MVIYRWIIKLMIEFIVLLDLVLEGKYCHAVYHVRTHMFSGNISISSQITQCRIILLSQPITKLYLFTIELKLPEDFRCYRSKMCFRTFSTVSLNSPILRLLYNLTSYKLTSFSIYSVLVQLIESSIAAEVWIWRTVQSVWSWRRQESWDCREVRLSGRPFHRLATCDRKCSITDGDESRSPNDERWDHWL